MKRWRMVSEQNGHEHVSTVVVSEGEAFEELEAEMMMHKTAGWAIDEIWATGFRASKGDTVRAVMAKSYSPFDDTR